MLGTVGCCFRSMDDDDDDDDGTVAKQANFASLHLNEERCTACTGTPVQTGREELDGLHDGERQKFLHAYKFYLLLMAKVSIMS